MNLRIQTYGAYSVLLAFSTYVFLFICFSIDGTTVYDALEQSLDDLMDLCDVVTEKFTEARDAFDEEQKNRMET